MSEDKNSHRDELHSTSFEPLISGVYAIKYGRRGLPKGKLIICDTHGHLSWRALYGRTIGELQLKDVTDIIAGKQTDTFKRKICENIPERYCCSIVTPKRTLDIVVSTEELRNQIVTILQRAVAHIKIFKDLAKPPVSPQYQSTIERVHSLLDQVRYLHSVLSHSGTQSVPSSPVAGERLPYEGRMSIISTETL